MDLRSGLNVVEDHRAASDAKQGLGGVERQGPELGRGRIASNENHSGQSHYDRFLEE